jgi:hypothetical protein
MTIAERGRPGFSSLRSVMKGTIHNAKGELAFCLLMITLLFRAKPRRA